MRPLAPLSLMLLVGCVHNVIQPYPQPVNRFVLPLVYKDYTAPVHTAKKGVAWWCDGEGYQNDPRRSGASWAYNWRAQPWMAEGIESVPMIWGAQQMGQAIGGNSTYLLGFNEPDLARQANISPEAAAVLWRQIERDYPDRLLVAPVPSQEAPEWIDTLYRTYISIYGEKPRFDALAAHLYGLNKPLK